MKNWKQGFIGIVAIMVLVFAFITCDDGNKNNPQTFTVTFDADNGSTPTTQTVTEGSKANKPTDPTKVGYSFDSWYNTASNTEWDFNATVTADITLKAKWLSLYAGTWVDSSNSLTIVIANDLSYVMYESTQNGDVPLVKGTMSINDNNVIMTVTHQWEYLVSNDWGENDLVYNGTVNGYTSGSNMTITGNNNVDLIYTKQ